MPRTSSHSLSRPQGLCPNSSEVFTHVAAVSRRPAARRASSSRDLFISIDHLLRRPLISSTTTTMKNSARVGIDSRLGMFFSVLTLWQVKKRKHSVAVHTTHRARSTNRALFSPRSKFNGILGAIERRGGRPVSTGGAARCFLFFSKCVIRFFKSGRDRQKRRL